MMIKGCDLKVQNMNAQVLISKEAIHCSLSLPNEGHSAGLGGGREWKTMRRKEAGRSSMRIDKGRGSIKRRIKESPGWKREERLAHRLFTPYGAGA